jgi:hypothetical protein
MTNLGKLVKVNLRDIWKDEAGEFTPWLAEEKNIKELGDTIGIELEVESQEKEVGPFRADILCKDTANSQWVLIENQLERTDHTHLGQLLTYAAGLEAVSIIWIAETFSDEHRAALDWLNEKTEESINFFGLEIEVYRIGNSEPAPRFNIVCKPNDWSRTVRTSAANLELSDTEKRQLEYWTVFNKYMDENRSFIRCQSPYPQNFANFAIGRAYFGLCARITKTEIGVFLYISGPNRTAFYKLIEQEYKNQIESELNYELIWRTRQKHGYIGTSHEADTLDKDKWIEQHQWLKETLEKFHKVLSPIIKKLDATDYHESKE